MTFGAHLLSSWLLSVTLLKQRRERVLVTLAGVAPDLDALGGAVDSIIGTTDFYGKYHHYLGHSLFSAIIVSATMTFFAKAQRRTVWFLSFLVMHLHLLCDLVGSRGPDGYQWPIYYLYPFNSDIKFVWSGQWELNAWQNLLFLAVLFTLCSLVIRYKSFSFLELISETFDQKAITIYRKTWSWK